MQNIKLAHDDDNLFILLRFKTGIGEKFDQELEETGNATSGAIGYLHLKTENREFVLWLPTGFSSSFDTKTGQRTKFISMARYDLSEVFQDGEETRDIAGRSSDEDPEFLAYDDKFFELRIPLSELGITGNTRLHVKLDEF